MNDLRLLDKITELRTICKIISQLKSQLIERLPHYGHDALFLQNDEITTGLLNNKTEIKVYNMMGNLVMRQITNKTNTEVNVTKLPAGVYMVSANDGITTLSTKFVKE